MDDLEVPFRLRLEIDNLLDDLVECLVLSLDIIDILR